MAARPEARFPQKGTVFFSGPTKAGFSRRAFLKGSGAAAAATALSGRAALAQDEEPAVRVVGPDAVPVSLTVNGDAHQLMLSPNVTLLDALRNDLGITGPKYVCDDQVCGACTVLIDGEAHYACTRLAVEAQDADIRTPESLVNHHGELDPAAQAFVNHDAMQCGFCTPGFCMAVRAFLNENPHATLEDVHEGLGGNICRCGTYANVIMAALEVAGGGADV